MGAGVVELETSVSKMVRREAAYYTIRWSRLQKADRYGILSLVPSMAGIFELYYLDRKNKLNLFIFAKAWYGGLRNHLRTATDAALEQDPARRSILERHPCYYRYALLNSYRDMADIHFFFAATHFPRQNRTSHSGRYARIFVKELSPDKLVTI